MPEHSAEKDAGTPTYTRRQYLTYATVLTGVPMFMATEAVASTAIEHPEWDMSERRTWDEWERVLPPATTEEDACGA